MLELSDFWHLPQLEPLIEQVIADGPGLIVLAGLDPRPATLPAGGAGFLPSGRAAILRILMRQILEAQPGAQAIVVTTSKEATRLPASVRRRVKLALVPSSGSYDETITEAADRRPDLLVVDCLSAESAAASLRAAQAGLRVLSQLDTVFRGAEVVRHLLDLGVPTGCLKGLAWVVAVQRLATLCPHCKQPASPEPGLLAEMHRLHPELGESIEDGTFYRPAGCRQCRMTGREGEVAAFDIYRGVADGPDLLAQPSLLPLATYLLGLAAHGLLPLDDVIHLETDRLRRTYGLLAASERALSEANTELMRRLAELEAANRVLQQRTQALISLEGIGQALITSTGLHELAGQLCRHAQDLCGADRVILYFLHPRQSMAEVVSVCGWDPSLVGQHLEASLVIGTDPDPGPAPSDLWPPGVAPRASDVTASALRAGLRMPLIAQGTWVGLLVVHSHRKSRFSPGEVALLQTFANQAALAVQRAGLIETLQDKVAQLETAQAELVEKERLERELELARQVQQSVLPRIFPLVPGYSFAARSEPARWVGGDFYDVILLDASHFGLAIGDVSDKGMPAALYMAQTHSLMSAEARRGNSPRTVLHNVHRLLQQLGRSEMFVTVFYGVVDVLARRLTYARAGHDQPLVLRDGQILSLGGEGTVLGFPDLEDPYLSEEHFDLEPGDRLLLYTDGLIDALSSDGRPFGLNRLLSLLRTRCDLAPAELCARLFDDLADYRGTAEQYDDMTLLVVGLE